MGIYFSAPVVLTASHSALFCGVFIFWTCARVWWMTWWPTASNLLATLPIKQPVLLADSGSVLVELFESPSASVSPVRILFSLHNLRMWMELWKYEAIHMPTGPLPVLGGKICPGWVGGLTKGVGRTNHFEGKSDASLP